MKIATVAQYFTIGEIKEILFSVLAISLGLALAVSGEDPISRLMPEPSVFAENFLLFFVAISPGFVLHEMAHKFTAIYYGCRARFKAWTFGIGLMFVFAIGFGFIFAAPGAVYIFAPYLNRKENGIISSAGAVVNLIIATISLIAMVVLSMVGFPTGSFWLKAASFSTFINGFLAAFNMVPMHPLDGGKVISWNITAWVGILITSLLVVGIFNIDAVQFIIFLIIVAFLLRMLIPTRRII